MLIIKISKSKCCKKKLVSRSKLKIQIQEDNEEFNNVDASSILDCLGDLWLLFAFAFFFVFVDFGLCNDVCQVVWSGLVSGIVVAVQYDAMQYFFEILETRYFLKLLLGVIELKHVVIF